MIKVIKRNGTEVEFDKSKIVNAIRKAWIQVYNDPLNPEPKYFNTIADSIERWADVTRKDNYSIILNDRINTKKKNPAMDERELLLKFYPSAKDLFTQSHEMIVKGGRWRI